MVGKLDQEAMKDDVRFRAMLDTFVSEFAIGTVLNENDIKAVEAKGECISGIQYDKSIIALGRLSDFFDGVSLEEGILLQYGLFWNEILHLNYTPFEQLLGYGNKLDEKEYTVFRFINKVLEDATMLPLSENVVGGTIKESLEYLIKWRFDHYSKIGGESTAWQQYVNALVQSADRGIVNGTFTFPEAEDHFYKTVDVLLTGAKEPDGEKRAEISLSIVDMTRDLWMPDASSVDCIKAFLSHRNDGVDLNLSLDSYDRDTFIEDLLIREDFEKKMNSNKEMIIDKPRGLEKIEKLADHEFKDISGSEGEFAKSLLERVFETYKNLGFGIYLKKVGTLENNRWIKQDRNKTEKTETWIKNEI